jgi:hypothetical protein
LDAGVAQFDAFVQLAGIDEALGKDAEAAESYSAALNLMERQDIRAGLIRTCQTLKRSSSAAPSPCG